MAIIWRWRPFSLLTRGVCAVFQAAALALYIRPFSPNAGANDRSGPDRKLSKALGAKKLLVPFGRVSSGALVDVDPG
jgi:hypothetical protein